MAFLFALAVGKTMRTFFSYEIGRVVEVRNYRTGAKRTLGWRDSFRHLFFDGKTRNAQTL